MEELTATEVAVTLAEENQTRKILELVEKSKDKEEAVEKIRTLLQN
ncbi:MAG: protein phosphatase [Defluviitaleaceae bacterium]|nr:protein phosphatase [Defluviitaleaceae bacterium]